MITLREVVEADLDIFFDHQQDNEAVFMAAFTSKNPADRSLFDAHWEKIRANNSNIIRTIEVDGRIGGHIASFDLAGERNITYWIGREFWGKGVAPKRYMLFYRWIRRARSMAVQRKTTRDQFGYWKNAALC